MISRPTDFETGRTGELEPPAAPPCAGAPEWYQGDAVGSDRNGSSLDQHERPARLAWLFRWRAHRHRNLRRATAAGRARHRQRRRVHARSCERVGDDRRRSRAALIEGPAVAVSPAAGSGSQDPDASKVIRWFVVAVCGPAVARAVTALGSSSKAPMSRLALQSPPVEHPPRAGNVDRWVAGIEVAGCAASTSGDASSAGNRAPPRSRTRIQVGVGWRSRDAANAARVHVAGGIEVGVGGVDVHRAGGSRPAQA